MNIKWLGHSSFLFESSSGVRIITDPYDQDIGFTMPSLSADIVTVSHAHHDHSNVKAVSGNPMIVNNKKTVIFRDVKIEGLKTYHDGEFGKLRGENIVFKYYIDGLVLCHMGDIGQDVDKDFIVRLGKVDVLFIPIGGTYTVDYMEAYKYVLGIEPKIVVPMHYKTKGLDINISCEKSFISQFGRDKINDLRKDSFQVHLVDIEGKSAEVFLLSRN